MAKTSLFTSCSRLSIELSSTQVSAALPDSEDELHRRSDYENDFNDKSYLNDDVHDDDDDDDDYAANDDDDDDDDGNNNYNDNYKAEMKRTWKWMKHEMVKIRRGRQDNPTQDETRQPNPVPEPHF